MESCFSSAARFGLVLLLVSSFIVPSFLAAPQPVSAGVMKWDTVNTPAAVLERYDVLNPENPTIGGPWGSEIQDLAVGQNDSTLAAIVRTQVRQFDSTLDEDFANYLFLSSNSGISFTFSKQRALDREDNWFNGVFDENNRRNLYQVAIAPDNPNVIAVTSDDETHGVGGGPRAVWITTDGGANWDQIMPDGFLPGGETIRALDISPDYGGKRDIAVATYTGGFGGSLWVRPSDSFSDWVEQDNPDPAMGFDYQAVRFSPSYSSDSAIAVVFCNGPATYYNVALRDLDDNTVVEWAFSAPGIEVKDPTSADDTSPDTTTLRRADLELPSDFSGQSASLRRAYISLDAGVKNAQNQTGIFRIDDTTVYRLMDTTATPNKNIYSIAYHGSYASGKLLAGERDGFPCTATVPTWFTDSPTTCPIPCWYPALKPTTGAANPLEGICAPGSQTGVGAALVAWNASASLGLVATGSNAVWSTAAWYQGWLQDPRPNDESAFAISRNNGETWNQLSLIDTTIDWFNDVVSSPDCTTLYLASANRFTSENQTNQARGCDQFDSVWRATVNMNVASPLPAVHPIGQYWERVYARVTQLSCTDNQSDLPILRVPTGCDDKPNGEIVAWAAQYTRAQAWSPDFGDFWATVTPRHVIQDFCFETSTVMYDLSPDGLVQRLPYTGTSWSTTLASVDTILEGAHTIAAYPTGNVLVGVDQTHHTYAVSFSSNMHTASPSFRLLTGAGRTADMGDVHVVFDPDFKGNRLFYIGDEWESADGTDTDGSVYRNATESELRWQDTDMMSASNNNSGSDWPPPAVGPPHNYVGQFGLVVAYTGDPQPALYSAHHAVITSASPPLPDEYINSTVCRTLTPREGIPKPGVPWDCLDIFTPLNQTDVLFTLEPTSLKYCGCCSLDTDTTLYAIDNQSGGTALSGRWNGHLYDPWRWGYTPLENRGMLWAYTDCLAKRPPVMLSPAAGAFIGCDPVTGRNQQIDLRWEQLCLATEYYVAVAKDEAFDFLVWGENVTMDRDSMLNPAGFIAPAGLPEAGATYWWKVQVLRSATLQIARSPTSHPIPFSVKPGFKVGSAYYGVQLLAPSNGCVDCAVRPVSFSWAPWKESSKYEFVLSKDYEFKQPVVVATTTTTGYAFGGNLDHATSYFWRVRGIEINGQPIPSDWSATFSFRTAPAPEPQAPPAETPATPLVVWIAMAIGALLAVFILILIIRTGR